MLGTSTYQMNWNTHNPISAGFFKIIRSEFYTGRAVLKHRVFWAWKKTCLCSLYRRFATTRGRAHTPTELKLSIMYPASFPLHRKKNVQKHFSLEKVQNLLNYVTVPLLLPRSIRRIKQFQLHNGYATAIPKVEVRIFNHC